MNGTRQANKRGRKAGEKGIEVIEMEEKEIEERQRERERGR